MHRCYIDPSEWDISGIKLSSDEEHHLLTVMRAKQGETITVFDGNGHEALMRIEQTQPLELKLVKENTPLKQKTSITIIQALPKGKRMDLIVEKCTELGIASILPVVSDCVITRLDEKQRNNRVERWRRIALSAAKQCGTSWTMEIKPVCDYENFAEECNPFDLLLIGVLDKNADSLHSVIDNHKSKKPKHIGLLIGPEGDFTEEEIKLAINAGATPVHFTTPVLRVETASIYGASILAYEFFV